MNQIWRTISLAPKVCTHDAVDVSANAVVAISTEDGVQIIDFGELITQQTTQPSYRVTQIKCEKHRPVDVNISQDKLFSGDDFVCNDIAKELLITNDKKGNTTIFSKFGNETEGYKKARWSPSGMDKFGRCVIATLSTDHRLAVYAITEKDILTWIEELQLTKLLCDSELECGFSMGGTVEEPDDTVLKYKHRISSITTTDLVWFPHLIECEKHKETSRKLYGLLATTTKSGHLILWRIYTPISDRLAHIDKTVYLGEDIYVNSMVWCDHGQPNDSHLVIGCVNGQILLLSLADYTISHLWAERDQIPVKTLAWDRLNDVIIAGKGVYVVTLPIPDPNAGSSPKTSTQVIASKLAVSSITVAKDNTVYVVTADGVLMSGCVKKQEQSQEWGLTLEPWVLNRPQAMRLRNHGVVLSPNSSILMLVESPAANYCPHIYKQPLKIQMVICQSEEKICEALVSPSNDSMQRVTDMLMCVKSYMAQEQGGPAVLTVFIESVGDTSFTETYTFYQLKLLRYLIQLKVLFFDRTAPVELKEELQTKLSNVETAIIVRYVVGVINQVVASENSVPCTSQDYQALARMKKLLENNKDLSVQFVESNKIDQTLQLLQDNWPREDESPAAMETCVICKNTMSVDSLRTSSCCKEHSFDVCVQTMLCCQAFPYRKCQWCGALALMKRSKEGEKDWLAEIQTNICPLCDHTLVPCH